MAGLTGTGVNSANDSGVWVGGPGTLQVVARTGPTGPGTQGLGPGVDFSFMDNPAINAAGQVAFSAASREPTSGANNQYGLWSGGPDRRPLSPPRRRCRAQALRRGTPSRHWCLARSQCGRGSRGFGQCHRAGFNRRQRKRDLGGHGGQSPSHRPLGISRPRHGFRRHVPIVRFVRYSPQRQRPGRLRGRPDGPRHR